MKTYIAKLNHILPTFLIISIGSVCGLSFIRWILCIQYSLLDIKEDNWMLWIPIGFPWIPITLWLRQRFRILTFKDSDKGRFGFQIISWAILVAPLLISQHYLTTATGKLKELSSIKEIEKTERTRYYKFSEFSVASYYGGAYTDFRASGKHNQYLDIHVYFVAPILSDSSEKIIGVPKHWYGINFKEQISNKISSSEKEIKYKKFYDECVEKYEKYDFDSLDHFLRTPTSEDRDNYLKAVEARTNKPVDNNSIILEPIQERYEERNGNKLFWIFGSFGIGLTVLLFSLIWPGYCEIEKVRFLEGKKPEQDDLIDMLNYLIPKGEHFSTSIILDLNIIVFLVMILSGVHFISPNGLELLNWGANRRNETTGGEWWRLFTSIFVHGGIMHLFLNIYGLVLAAIFVEPILGRKKYIVLYLMSGICGSIASIWWYPNTISVGASGAIFGLYGSVFGLLLTDAFPKDEKKGILIMIGIYVAINLLWGLTGGIDNAAHIGGLISGGFLGIVLYKLKNNQKNGI